jgi:hypothetical protein
VSALLGSILILIWDGFHMIGEGFGLTGRRANTFADVSWIIAAALIGSWLVLMSSLIPR